MALKAVHVSDVPNLDQVPKGPTIALSSSLLPKGMEDLKSAFKPAKFVVIGHRGKGMNALASPDRRMKEIKENSILSFNLAGRFPVDFVEFDVQVTADDCAIIFHDNFILTEEDGNISEKRVTDLTLEEFFSYGPQREPGKVGKKLFRKTKDGRVFNWNVEIDDPLCPLEEAFQRVDSHVGFNIELKFDDNLVYQEEKLMHILQVILQVVDKYANERTIIFSSFQPDAALLIRKLQGTYPVFFLTNGGSEIYSDVRRNSLDEAIKLCLAGGLQGIVSEVKAIFRNPSMIPRIKESNLALLTYGQLNNVPEAVYMQHLMGINGVIVDLVQEITEAVSDFINPETVRDESLSDSVKEGKAKESTKLEFSQRELSFLMRLIPELVQQ
ncbi:glycerophosphodiester phosphodiesterase GDPD1, chloroplastic [Elaeis guineensis]|uniref:glycerophosphodiester phosphodiesterase n=1 Tax=Elaeis guineensis var. tenera TaxID=51953 RepID=A0A6I9RP28_ELAGV|nr:glycerophosphodiester phosphodiesterase GDPD1, chloroplastic [Elaeis guineensis]